GVTSVLFHEVEAVIESKAATVIHTSVPPGASTGPIRVAAAYGGATSTNLFFVGGVPVITNAPPSIAKASATIVLTGQQFTAASRVAFGAASSAQFTVDSDTQITAHLDAAASTGKIQVTTPVGTGQSAFDFTLLPPDPSPQDVRVRDVPNDQGGL